MRHGRNLVTGRLAPFLGYRLDLRGL
ncbi:hypothetical protein BN873_360041 [Candidatus Competibacter denitrificans Run_A_D11]|uniref:Uncharacterized protein n=1 Tax=Candidatus Competibacter denitrificans Run_A_D11 TaxID=1400863 RepID=W6M5C3_9GAMM|nr:hypothetical protein BN873_360041 [Candidatus Competibacter denitrificans Run_A_D11]